MHTYFSIIAVLLHYFIVSVLIRLLVGSSILVGPCRLVDRSVSHIFLMVGNYTSMELSEHIIYMYVCSY